MKKFFLKLISDEQGEPSSARFLNILIGVSSVLIVWKLVLMDKLSADIFAFWLAYGAGVSGFHKYCESKKDGEEK